MRHPTVSFGFDGSAILRSALCAEYLGELAGLEPIRAALCEQAA